MTSSDPEHPTGRPSRDDDPSAAAPHRPHDSGHGPYGPPEQGASPSYGQPSYGQGPYGQAPYGAPQQPGQAGAAAPNHPSATTALVLGLIGLAGLAFCGGLTLVLSPFAWQLGARAVRDIDASPHLYGGRDLANAGRITGIVGTVLLGVGVLLVLGLIGVFVGLRA